MYTFEIIGDPPRALIKSNDIIIDNSGPWESVESATTWASTYANALNEGTVTPEEPS
jgi:hypothetical protein